MTQTAARPVTHASFTLQRTYPRAPEVVFAAIASPSAKRRWLVEGEGFEVVSYEPGFGAGAFERSSFRFKGGPLVRNDTVYLDVNENRRIIFAYSMSLEGTPMSSSLVTMLLEPAPGGTRLTLTEQGAYLEGFDDVAGREQGTRELLERLHQDIERTSSAAQ
ncbi:SRPBCC family protein [Xanthobacter pseudotagetidis]|uniref:SRPBCC family protein n=1 Tax=Xanthobacter pseudotagetidis TaxID=3119911 RepID=UPI003726CB2A